MTGADRDHGARAFADALLTPDAATAAPVERPDILSIDEVAQWLGLDRKTVYEAARRGELPCARLGRRLRVSRAAVEQILAGRRP